MRSQFSDHLLADQNLAVVSACFFRHREPNVLTNCGIPLHISRPELPSSPQVWSRSKDSVQLTWIRHVGLSRAKRHNPVREHFAETTCLVGRHFYFFGCVQVSAAPLAFLDIYATAVAGLAPVHPRQNQVGVNTIAILHRDFQ